MNFSTGSSYSFGSVSHPRLGHATTKSFGGSMMAFEDPSLEIENVMVNGWSAEMTGSIRLSTIPSWRTCVQV